jgi:dienelactone hydrolase
MTFVAAAMLVAIGLTAAAGAQPAQVNVTVSVDKDAAGGMFVKPDSDGVILVDQPLKIVIQGLGSKQQFRLQVASEDAGVEGARAEGGRPPVLWQSGLSRLYTAEESGPTTLTSKSRSLGGCVMRNDDIMRLFGEMKPYKGNNPQEFTGLSYAWLNENRGTFTVKVLDVSGKSLFAKTDVVRSFGKARERTLRRETTDSPRAPTHWYGKFFEPSPPRQEAAILIFGGSEGGLAKKVELHARLLAAHGYATLAMAYWKGKEELEDRGDSEVNRVPASESNELEKALTKLPLETFRSALRKLAEQPGVPNGRLFVSGTSRGSEAALWLAAHPEFVDDEPVEADLNGRPKERLSIHGVVANVPSSVVHRCFPDRWVKGDCKVAAWSKEANPVDHAPVDNDPRAAPTAAWLSVGNFRGPAFLDCGGWDDIWVGSSPGKRDMGCAYLKRLGELGWGGRDNVVARTCTDAGHGVASLVPYLPWDPSGRTERSGTLRGSGRWANHNAHAALWPQLLAFLKKYGSLPQNR